MIEVVATSMGSLSNRFLAAWAIEFWGEDVLIVEARLPPIFIMVPAMCGACLPSVLPWCFFVLLSYLIALSNEMVDVLSFRKPRTQELKRVCANGDDSIFIDNSGENQ